MNSASPDRNELVSLRREICSAADASNGRFVWVTLTCALAWLGMFLVVVAVSRLLGYPRLPLWVNLVWTFFGSVVVGRLSMSLAASYRRRRRAALRERVRSLQSPELASLLDSLSRAPEESTRVLAHELARDLDLPAELSPSSTPDGSGTEPAALPHPS